VFIADKKSALETMKNANKKGQKFIYLMNSASGFDINIYDDLIDINDERCIDPSEIAVIMSEEKKNKVLDETQAQIMNVTLKSLAERQLVPQDISVVLTTTKLKEGININNEDIRLVFCESHYFVDMIQFAGRLRNGIDEFVIIDDAKQNNQNSLLEIDYKYCTEEELNSANNYLGKCVERNEDWGETLESNLYKENQSVKEFVDFIESKFSFIRYNYFNNEFQVYKLRYEAKKHYIHSLNEYSIDLGSHENQDKVNYIKRVLGVEQVYMLQSITPQQMICEYIKEKQLIDKTLTREEANELLEVCIKEGLKSSKGTPYTKISYAMNACGFNVQRAGNHNDGDIIITEK
jgi:hypothetical protein